MSMAKTVVAWVVAVGVLVAGFAWLAGWFYERVGPERSADRAAAARSRPTAEVTSTPQESLLPVPGRLRAERRTRVTSEIPGKITEVVVTGGDRVEPGAVLVRLDRTELQARADRIREQIPAQQARIGELRADLERDRQLVSTGAVSREAFQSTQRALVEAEANLAATEQRLTEAEGDLSETVVAATLRGIVVEQLAKPGEVARPGVPLLEIYQPETLRLEVAVPESLAATLSVGQSLTAAIGGSRSAACREVTIDEIIPQSETDTGTVLVKAKPDGLPERHVEGLYGRLFVPLGVTSLISVPASAVRSDGQLDLVDVQISEGVFERRHVKTGRRLADDRLEILSGLSAGETVALRPGDSVRQDNGRR